MNPTRFALERMLWAAKFLELGSKTLKALNESNEHYIQTPYVSVATSDDTHIHDMIKTLDESLKTVKDAVILAPAVSIRILCEAFERLVVVTLHDVQVRASMKMARTDGYGGKFIMGESIMIEYLKTLINGPGPSTRCGMVLKAMRITSLKWINSPDLLDLVTEHLARIMPASLDADELDQISKTPIKTPSKKARNSLPVLDQGSEPLAEAKKVAKMWLDLAITMIAIAKKHGPDCWFVPQHFTNYITASGTSTGRPWRNGGDLRDAREFLMYTFDRNPDSKKGPKKLYSFDMVAVNALYDMLTVEAKAQVDVKLNAYGNLTCSDCYNALPANMHVKPPFKDVKKLANKFVVKTK